MFLIDKIILFFQWLWFGKKPADRPAPVGTPVSAATPVAGDYMATDSLLPNYTIPFKDIFSEVMSEVETEKAQKEKDILERIRQFMADDKLQESFRKLIKYMAANVDGNEYSENELLIGASNIGVSADVFPVVGVFFAKLLREFYRDISIRWLSDILAIKRSDIKILFCNWRQEQAPTIDIDEKMRTMLHAGPYR
jgi:hypothetical protein